MRRLRELRLKAGLSQSVVAAALGVTQQAYANYESAKRELSPENLRKLADFFDVSVDYILERDNFGSDVTSSKPPSSPDSVWIPVLGDVAAGIPIETITDIVGHEEIPKALAATGEFFGLRIKGGSMEPRICAGDVVIVRKQDDAETGDIAVVLVNGDAATVKKIKKRPEGLLLIPLNPAYETMFYSVDDVATLPVQIIGKVVELRGKF